MDVLKVQEQEMEQLLRVVDVVVDLASLRSICYYYYFLILEHNM